MEQISGFIERLTFHNAENGFTVAQLKSSSSQQLICLVGIMPGIRPGESVRCFGHWKNHLIHGRQFEIEKFQVEAPADRAGILKYLSSGLIKGIGPTYAGKIVDQFGTDTLSIIEQSPELLLNIPGLGSKRIDKITKCWTDQRAIRDVMIFLQTYDMSPTFAQKIFKKYGNQSIARVKENPYSLAQDIFGVGFKTADQLAQKMGIAKESYQRIDAGIEYVLSELASDGHVCYPADEFCREAEKFLEMLPSQIQARLPYLQQENRIEMREIIENGKSVSFIWLKKLFLAEIGIGRELRRLKKEHSSLRPIAIDKAIVWVQKELQLDLAANQKQAVMHACKDKLHIITGGPGTGKSTITKAILAIANRLTEKILLAAPTGRAAKRMSEITGKKATTIHSLLEVDFKTGGFKRNKNNPLDCDLIIIDEASMIDTYLMYSLLKAIPNNARVIFVGDIHQLPSVGPGTVLKDMISSLSISVTTLNEIYRQSAGSHIVTNAHRINRGIFPNLYNGKDSDFFFLESIENQDVLNGIIKLVSQRLPHRYGFNPMIDIQVLSPMKKGMIGTENLNQALQKALNPQEKGLQRSGYFFQVGDKVLQTRNDYQKEVYNGDIGTILSINADDEEVLVRFDDREVVYEYNDLDELVLAYAISIHKFQGSECPCVVIPVHTSHFMLLHRNLLYTGVTRGKKLVVLVGTKKALAIAVKKNDVQKRYTSLQQILMEVLES